jgi:hypothetical protein
VNVLERLRSSEAAYLAALEGIDDDAAARRPTVGGWSMLQVAEHVAVSERGVAWLLRERLPAAPAPDPSIDRERVREVLTRAVPDRGARIEAPTRLQPTGTFPSLAAAREAFTTARAGLMALAASGDASLRAHALPHPIFGELTGEEWLLFTSLHVERHTAQIVEIGRAVPHR